MSSKAEKPESLPPLYPYSKRNSGKKRATLGFKCKFCPRMEPKLKAVLLHEAEDHRAMYDALTRTKRAKPENVKHKAYTTGNSPVYIPDNEASSGFKYVPHEAEVQYLNNTKATDSTRSSDEVLQDYQESSEEVPPHNEESSSATSSEDGEERDATFQVPENSQDMSLMQIVTQSQSDRMSIDGYQCNECGKVLPTEHGRRVHYGLLHRKVGQGLP